MTRPIFVRPIEVTTGQVLDVNDGGGADNVTIGEQTYAHIGTLLEELEDKTQADTGNANFSWSFSSDMKVRVGLVGSDPLLHFDNVSFGYALGYDGNETAVNVGGTYYTTANYFPTSMWFPTYARTNQSFWALQQSEVWRGANAASGEAGGLGTGTDRREMSFEFQHEPAANVAKEFGTADGDINANFETFIYEAKAATITESTNTSNRGFFVFPDYTDLVPATDASANEGVEYGLSSSPDTHTFCHMKARGSGSIPVASLPATRARFNVSFACITATAPTWDTVPSS